MSQSFLILCLAVSSAFIYLLSHSFIHFHRLTVCLRDVSERKLSDEENERKLVLLLLVGVGDDLGPSVSLYLFQGMLEMNLTNFKIGGMNITGFSLVDPTKDAARIILDKWKTLDERQWPGAGTANFKVNH